MIIQSPQPIQPIVHLIPVTSNYSINHPTVVGHLVGQVVTQASDAMNPRLKCNHSKPLSSSPITKYNHCGQYWCPPEEQKTIPTDKLYKSQSPLNSRARMSMKPALEVSTPVVNHIRPIDDKNRVSYHLHRVITHYPNPKTSPEVIDLGEDFAQENDAKDEEIATQTDSHQELNDEIEIMDINRSQSISRTMNKSSSNSSLKQSVNESDELFLKLPIQTFPDYVMFGTYKTQLKSMEITDDGIKLTNVTPNSEETKFKYHIMIPFTEVEKLLYCLGNTSPMILIKPLQVSCDKMQESMFLGSNWTNGLELNINSNESKELFIIVVLKEKISEEFAITLKRCSEKNNTSIECQAMDSKWAKLVLKQSQCRSATVSHVIQSRGKQIVRSLISSISDSLIKTSGGSAFEKTSDSSDSPQSSSPHKRIFNRSIAKTSVQTITIEIEDLEEIINTNRVFCKKLCKECRGAFPIVKCTYCRTEFQQESKSSVISICKKCEQNVKQFGKPSACDYCNIIAAFIGSKCQRCTNSEKKYGPPLTCEQCKQRCAFDRKDPESRKKVEGKLLCWLCTLSYKRALAKAKQNDSSIRHTSISALKASSRSSSRHHSKDEMRSHHKHHRSSGANSSHNSSSALKKPRLDLTKTSNGSTAVTTSSTTTTINSMNDSSMDSSEHMIAVAQLREKVLSLEKQLKTKEKELMNKDVEMNKLRSAHRDEMKDQREKNNDMQKKHLERVHELNQKITMLSKQNATLNKAAKKSVTPNDSPLL